MIWRIFQVIYRLSLGINLNSQDAFIFPPSREMEGRGEQRDEGPSERGSLRMAVVSSSWPFAPPSFQISSRDILHVLMEKESLYLKNRKLNFAGRCTLRTLPCLLCNHSRWSHATLPVRDSGSGGCEAS